MAKSLSCPDCHGHVAGDQRYCLSCGARLLPLPSGVAATLSQLATESAPRAPRARNHPDPPVPVPVVPTLFGVPLERPSPGSIAACVLCLLAFGTVVGTTNVSLANSPLTILVDRATGTYQVLPSTSGNAASTSAGASGASSTPSGGASAAAASTSATASTTTATTTTTTTPAPKDGLPPIKHVWLIVLGDQGYQQTFAAGSPDHYLTALTDKGEMVPNFYAVSQGDLANEIALISGQGPTPQTVAGCLKYVPLHPEKVGRNEQVVGHGCVYPAKTPNLPAELTAAKYTWRAYVQGLVTACQHPKLNATDRHFIASKRNGYATWRDPFVYFRGITQSSSCPGDVVGAAQLAADLSAPAKTPNVSFVLAGGGADAGRADTLLKSIVPKIMASAAYKQDGMILITSAQAPPTGPNADHSSCCGQPSQYPNLPVTTTTTPTGATTTPTGTTTTPTGTTTTPPTGTTTTSTGITTTTTTPASPTPTTTTTTTTTTPTGPAPMTTTPTGTTTGPISSTPPGVNPTGGGGQVGLLVLSPYVQKGLPDGDDTFNDFSVVGSLEQLFGLKATGYATSHAVPLFSTYFYSNYTPPAG